MKSAFQLIVKRTGKAIGDFGMIQGGDKVAVGISGGKDSLTLFLALQALQRRAKEKYEIVPVLLSVDNQPPASDLFAFFENIGSELQWFPSNIYKSVSRMNEERPGESPCRLCSRFRRAILYERIKTIGCNKLALGHHMDDMVETYLLNLFFAGKTSGMPPAAKALNHNILLIRPMAYIRESLILEFITNTHISLPKEEACPLLPDGISTRTVIRNWLTQLRKHDERIMDNAFAALKKANFFCPATHQINQD